MSNAEELQVRMFNKLSKAISDLASAVRDASSQQQTNAILQRLAQMEENMALKVSELKTEVAGLKTQVTKIWNEQQSKYDALKVDFDQLAATLANQEIDAEAQTELDGFKTLLTQFDDTIPDTTA